MPSPQTIELLAHPETTAAIAQQGYEHARKTFALDVQIASFDKAIEINN